MVTRASSSYDRTMPACPIGAEVTPTPLMAAQQPYDRCFGRPAPRPASLMTAQGLGALITITSDRMNAEDTLRSLLSTNHALDLRMVLATVDFKDKSGLEAAAKYRRSWAKSNVVSLQRMSESLHSISGVPVLVELVDMGGSCMARQLSQLAFRNYGTSGCGSRAGTCNTSTFWKNTVAFSWGLVRMASCTRYVVHVDNDIRLVTKKQQHAVPWVRRAMGVLQANESLLSVHPLRGPGACSFARRGEHRCSCRLGRDSASGGLHITRAAVLPASNSSAAACLLTYEGPHKPGVPHFSIQAFVMDLQRFQRVWPLTPSLYKRYGPYDHTASPLEAARADWLQRFEIKRGIRRDTGKVDPESIFEESAREQGLEIVYMAAAELGIEKAISRG